MKVSNDKTLTQYQDKLAKMQRNLITKKEKEIDGVAKLYDSKVEDQRARGEENLYNQTQRNSTEIEQEIANKESRLEKIKIDLAQNNEKFEAQKNIVTSSYQDQIENLNNVHDENIKELYSTNLAQGKEIHEDLGVSLKSLQDKVKSERELANFEAKTNSNIVERQHQKNLVNVGKVHQSQIKYAEGENEKVIEEIKSNHEKTVGEAQRKNQLDMGQKVETQELEKQNLDNKYNETLKQKRISFEEKYNTLEKQHTEILNRIKTRFDSEIKGIVNGYSETKKLHEQKVQDDFYHVTKVDPVVTDMPDHYIISINIPEHEREQVNLTAQERNLNFSLTRKFDEKTKNLNDEEYKTKRSEVITKKFSVADIMDSKDITQRYENGVLEFKIKKL